MVLVRQLQHLQCPIPHSCCGAYIRVRCSIYGVEKILDVAQRMDATTMQLQYLETLKQIGSGTSTKIVLPMELGALVSGLRGLLDISGSESSALESTNGDVNSRRP